jgi:BT4734-like, N-terminal domain
MVARAAATQIHYVDAKKIIWAIKSGRWERQVQEIRSLYAQTLLRTDSKSAKLAVDFLKKKLPAILPSGEFSSRGNDGLLQHSGLICGDLDSLGPDLQHVRDNLLKSPFLWALFVSPTGDGLKAFFRVPADPLKHLASFGAVERHVLELTATQIDQTCKDPARLCFVSFDPNLWFNPDAREMTLLPKLQTTRPAETKTCTPGALNERKRIAMELLGDIRWNSDAHGFLICPGKHLHTTGGGERDC